MDLMKPLIPRLEELAFEVSYKEILANLLLCHDHRPEGKKLDFAKYSSLLSTYLPSTTSEETRNVVRGCLFQHLIGTMSDKNREQYIERFSKSVKDCSNTHQIPDIWTFLDCVLDGSFQELKTHVALPGCEPSPKLVSTIANRCPQLQKLNLKFKLMEKKIWSKETLEPLILPLCSLHQLTSLTLSYLDVSHMHLLRLIGKSCPSLTYLTVDVGAYRNTTTKEMVLAVVLVEIIDHLVPNWDEELPEWCKDEGLWCLRIPPKYLSPLCSTLRQLTMMQMHTFTAGRGDRVELVKDSIGTFALRHIPFLHDLNLSGCTSAGIKLLCNPGRNVDPSIQTAFDIAFRDAAAATGLISPHVPAFKHLSSHAASGPLLHLTHIYDTSINYPLSVFRAIGSMCPSLKEIYIGSQYTKEESELDFTFGNDEVEISAETLEATLMDWPKIEFLSLDGIDSAYCKTFLNAFGPTLRELDLSGSNNNVFTLSDLVPCTNLEMLWISGFHSLDPKDVLPLSAETFLPNLKSFRSFICLGHRSHVFEQKTTLTLLDLNCSHIGTGVSPHLEWNIIPKLWSKMESLSIMLSQYIRESTGTCTGEPYPTVIRKMSS